MTLNSCSDSVVRLPTGQMGNSGAGHRHIGTNRYVPNDFSKINDAILNGGVDTAFLGKDRNLVPSPKIKTYDLQLKMNTGEVADNLAAALPAINMMSLYVIMLIVT